MRRLITTAMLAAVALPAIPTAATAQSRDELRRDRQDIRREQRDLDRAYRYGDRGDIRDQRGDLREARREYREDLRGRYGDRGRDWQGDRGRDWGRGDWSAYRQQNRALYARGNWRAPFGYQTFRPGVRIAHNFYGSRYVINDPWRYRLPPARGYTRWVRHYNDVILVDPRRGVVVDVIRNFYW